MLIAIIDGLLIFDRSARLDDCFYPCLIGNFHTIRKGEKCITRHHCAFQFKSKMTCFCNCLLQSVYSGSLTCTTGQQLLVFSKNDSIGFGMLHNLVCKLQIRYFYGSWGYFSYCFHILCCLAKDISVLLYNTVQ